MATIDFEGVILDGSLHYRGSPGWYTVTVCGPHTKQILPLIMRACMDEQATIAVNGRTFQVKEICWSWLGAKLVCYEPTVSDTEFLRISIT